MVFAPPVGFNLTFVCPNGQVFESDWLAMPFVMTTCQVLLWQSNFSFLSDSFYAKGKKLLISTEFLICTLKK